VVGNPSFPLILLRTGVPYKITRAHGAFSARLLKYNHVRKTLIERPMATLRIIRPPRCSRTTKPSVLSQVFRNSKAMIVTKGMDRWTVLQPALLARSIRSLGFVLTNEHFYYVAPCVRLLPLSTPKNLGAPWPRARQANPFLLRTILIAVGLPRIKASLIFAERSPPKLAGVSSYILAATKACCLYKSTHQFPRSLFVP
jgi:hypothetical protein